MTTRSTVSADSGPVHEEGPGKWRHEHNYLPAGHRRGEPDTHLVIALTGVTMIVEIVAGTTFNSMALLADGWHMASHASALGITAFAYLYARRHAGDSRYTFGTWKVGVLGGFSSAVGEMGEQIGAEVWLERVPLKYEGLSYTEIWISEAQERMTLSVPEEKWDELRRLWSDADEVL